MTIEQLIIRLNALIGPDITYEEQTMPMDFIVYHFRDGNMLMGTISKTSLDNTPYPSEKAEELIKSTIRMRGQLIKHLEEIKIELKILKEKIAKGEPIGGKKVSWDELKETIKKEFEK
jgi:hypothetical protein